MKTILKTLVVLIGLYVLLVVSLNVYSYFQKRSVPEMTPEKAQKLFETAGRINEVNREAKVLLNKFGTNDWAFLHSQDLTNLPAILSLYNSLENYSGSAYGPFVAIFPENGRHIEIKFGNHFIETVLHFRSERNLSKHKCNI
jgi:hypothetical protein